MRNILLWTLSALAFISTAHATTVSIQYHYDAAGRLTQTVTTTQ